MSSESDDPGSESDLDFDNTFGESEEEDNDFEGFLNNEIQDEIQHIWSPTADNNLDHFTEFSAANVGPSGNNTGRSS